MTDGRESAYPCNYELDSEGLTKRELFAAMAMQGLLSNSAIDSDNSPRDIAKVAVIEADALIEALNEGKEDAS